MNEKRPGLKQPEGRDLCLLLPTLNERENVVLQIQQVLTVFPQIGKILVLDDQSSDGTPHAVRQGFPACLASGQIQIISRVGPFGLTHALREGIGLSGMKWTAWMDCDLSMPPATLRTMLGVVQSGKAALCIGSRFLPGGSQKSYFSKHQDSRLEILLSSVGNWVIRKLLKVPCTDFTSGFCVGRTDVLRQLKWIGEHGEYFMQLMVDSHRKGFALAEVAYHCGTRKFGESKTSQRLLTNTLRALRTVVRLTCAKDSGVRTQPLWGRMEVTQANSGAR